MAFGVPVKVTVADCPAQIVWSEAMETVDVGKTVIVTVPVIGWLQPGVPEVAALTKV